MGLQLKKAARAVLAGCLLFALVLGVLPVNASTAQAAGDAVVNVSKTYQEIRGFGGMNHPSWIGDLTASQRERQHLEMEITSLDFPFSGSGLILTAGTGTKKLRLQKLL